MVGGLILRCEVFDLRDDITCHVVVCLMCSQTKRARGGNPYLEHHSTYCKLLIIDELTSKVRDVKHILI